MNDTTDYRHDLTAAVTSNDATTALWALALAPATDRHFPELSALAMDHRGRHKDVLDHTIQVAAKTPSRLTVRLAALCHDLGKPATRRFHDDGTVTFHDHENVGARLTRARLTTLGYGTGVSDHVARTVELSGRFKDSDDWTDAAVRRFVRDAGDSLDDLLDLCRVDVTSKHAWKHVQQARQVATIEARIAAVEAADATAAVRPDLDGRQVMDLLGIGPSAAVGQALDVLLEAKRNAGRPLDHDEAVTVVTTWWNTRQVA